MKNVIVKYSRICKNPYYDCSGYINQSHIGIDGKIYLMPFKKNAFVFSSNHESIKSGGSFSQGVFKRKFFNNEEYILKIEHVKTNRNTSH